MAELQIHVSRLSQPYLEDGLTYNMRIFRTDLNPCKKRQNRTLERRCKKSNK